MFKLDTNKTMLRNQKINEMPVLADKKRNIIEKSNHLKMFKRIDSTKKFVLTILALFFEST